MIMVTMLTIITTTTSTIMIMIKIILLINSHNNNVNLVRLFCSRVLGPKYMKRTSLYMKMLVEVLKFFLWVNGFEGLILTAFSFAWQTL